MCFSTIKNYLSNTILAVFLLLPVQAVTATSEIILSSKCNPQLQIEINKRSGYDSYVKIQAETPDDEIYRLKTKDPGSWLEIHYQRNATPKFFQITNANVIRFEYNAECRMQQTVESGLNFSKVFPDSTSKFVDDVELQKMIAIRQNGIIYIWSPSMIYSVKYLKRYRDTAKNLKIGFISLLDPKAKATDQHVIATDFSVPTTDLKMNSVNLFMLGGLDHFPTLFVFKNGLIMEETIVGVFDKETLRQKISKILGRLR